jgi:isopropylmalate/homocitrate/citramalate synthase
MTPANKYANSSTPWKTNHWWTSPYNFSEEITKDSHFPVPIELHDVTLRDGEQTPGVVFTRQDKLRIARALDEARVSRIEAGMPVVSDDDRLAIKDIAKAASYSKILAFCRARKQDVDAALSCDVSSIVMEIPALRERLSVMGLTPEKAAADALDAIQYAKSHGLFVVFFPFETTRADFGSITTMMRAGEEGHADRLAVVDTMGAASPEGFALLVKKVMSITKIPLEVHCHNPLGLGVANTLAGLRAGAKCAHVSLNGIGEGAGNVALEEVVLSLLLVHGIECGVDIGKMHEACKLVEELSRIPIAVNKPVLGRNVFRRESGIVVERYYKSPDIARELELFDPSWFAGETEIVLGKKSGKYSVLYMLRKKGINATDEQVNEMLNEIKRKSVETKTLVSEDQFSEIVSRVIGSS